jgi:hypothetical protein
MTPSPSSSGIGLPGDSFIDPRSFAKRLYEAKSPHVPALSMFDYALGGLDERLMWDLYGSHLGACSDCRQSMEVHARERPQDLTRLSTVPEFCGIECRHETYQLRKEAKKRLCDFILEASSELLIVGGEANPHVYSGEIEEALVRRAKAASCLGLSSPKVICGPAIGLGGEIRTPDQSILPKLAERGVIRLYIPVTRQKVHFRVNAGERVYTEAYHRAGDPSPRTGIWYGSASVADLFARRFQAILDSKQAVPYHPSRVAFVEMDAIECIQERTGTEFDNMTVEEIRRQLH